MTMQWIQNPMYPTCPDALIMVGEWKGMRVEMERDSFSKDTRDFLKVRLMRALNVDYDNPTVTRTKRVDGGEMRLRTYSTSVAGLSVYGFGVYRDDPMNRPGHGGEWSSRPSIVLEEMGVHLVEIATEGGSWFYVSLDVAKDMAKALGITLSSKWKTNDKCPTLNFHI
jgi:hypothetical protein